MMGKGEGRVVDEWKRGVKWKAQREGVECRVMLWVTYYGDVPCTHCSYIFSTCLIILINEICKIYL